MDRASTHTRLSAARVLLGVAGSLVIAALCTSTGCTKPLLSPDDERSPFARFDALRAQSAPQYIENEYGREEPNLRGRLTPKSN